MYFMEQYHNLLRGLSSQEVVERKLRGDHNLPPKSLTRTIPQIISDNVFTLFNIINIVLAVVVILVGELKNTMFLGVAVANTAIGIFQEIRAKLNVDKLAIVTQTKVTAIRDGNQISIPQEDIVLDDVMLLAVGNQICTDGVILLSEGLEVDESLLTGESDSIKKAKDSLVMSGSFVVAGSALVKVTAVGENSYAAKLTSDAKREKKPKSELIRAMNSIIKFLTFTIIPIGILMFCSKYFTTYDFKSAALGATASMIGIIPEGLILLTGVAFAVGAVNLTRRKTLVQSMPCIETLARVDVLCLDKTGTITDGTLTVIDTVLYGDASMDETESAISAVTDALTDDNATSKALKHRFKNHPSWEVNQVVPFSSKRKYSGCSFKEKGSFVIGAPEFIFSELPRQVQEDIDQFSAQGYRVIAFAHSSENFSETALPEQLSLRALIVISDHIRPEAPDTFRFFAAQGVDIKVISGDNALTVSSICKRAGLKGAEKFIDMSTVADDADFKKLSETNTVFGRVTPYQKQKLIMGLKENKHTVAMTGDGVNDVLALKEADCSIAMAQGSDAARTISDFVLLDSNFSSMVSVVKEGRRVVNNIGRVASLYLTKTIYTVVLSIIFIFIPMAYPFVPIQLSLISTLTVGIPSFFLTLKPSYQQILGRFISKVLIDALPAAIMIILNLLVIQLIGGIFHLESSWISTLCVIMTGVVQFILLLKVSKPLDLIRKVMIGLLITALGAAMIFFGGFFSLSNLFTPIAFVYIPLIAVSVVCYKRLSLLILRIMKKTRRKFTKAGLFMHLKP